MSIPVSNEEPAGANVESTPLLENADGHVPVLVNEVCASLEPRGGGIYVDCTVGSGGHAAAILAASAPTGRLLGIDRDAEILEIARERLARFGDRVTLVHGHYRDLLSIAARAEVTMADGVLFDLGVNSRQFDDAARGFSLKRDGPLDMRFDRRVGATAADLVNSLPETRIAEIIRSYGEEPRARSLARRIVEARSRGPLTTTGQLATAIDRGNARSSRVHPATRVFQALRIAVNDEIEPLAGALHDAFGLLREGGVLAVISFHSLEDRTVKRFIEVQARPCICPPQAPVCTCGRAPAAQRLGKGSAVAAAEELARNPRARSARLRCARRIGTPR